MSPEIVGLSILLIGLMLVIAKVIRIFVPFFSKFFLPSSVIAGILFLLLGPEVIGRLTPFEYGLFSASIIEVLGSLPGLLISVIFASLFLGKKIPKAKDIWLMAGPQAAFGQTIAWGQYVLGILVAILILVPFFGANPMVGALIEIAFQGGHGTSAGLASTFDELGFSEGADLAIGLATVGVVSGVIFGVFIINWGVRKHKTKFLKDPSEFNESQLRGIIDPEEREGYGKMSVSPESIEPLALHFGVIAIAILLGQGLLSLFLFIEQNTYASNGGFQLFAYMPLFPLAMIGGVVVQLFLDKFDSNNLISRPMINRIQGLALDFLIVSAIAALSLQVIGENIVIFLTLAIVGISWNLFAFFFFARRMIPKYWFERGIGDLGQSMGMTAAGLMLIRIVDSEGETGAMEAFGYKQLMFEPLVGGGFMTALSVPLIYQFGPIPILIFSFVVMLIWMMLGLLYFGKKDSSEIKA
ncbi:sodium/glutamate symporter [Liberiplasma polymorphum]|uniref:sodium/glutamate symporter n=1 Tax=Liberiplasma polymorphum TaxID=3374570 RepID=UPI0037716FEB